MSGLTVQQIEDGLIALGIPREKARWQALHECGLADPTTARAPSYPARAPVPASDFQPIVWPFRLILPWSYLVSDNAKYGVIKGKLVLTREYRRCKGLIRDRARPFLVGTEPAAIPLALEARVWVPDELRAHDVPNFAKLVHDSLEELLYVRDRWLYDTRWIRAGVDVDAPRCELTIRPLA